MVNIVFGLSPIFIRKLIWRFPVFAFIICLYLEHLISAAVSLSESYFLFYETTCYIVGVVGINKAEIVFHNVDQMKLHLRVFINRLFAL